MTGYLWTALAALVAAAGWMIRRQLCRQSQSMVTDDVVRKIETHGSVDAEDVEPLDLDRARAAEDEFWAQTWDQPDEDW